MAKSIRSNIKKKNRALMRKAVGDPFQKKLQAKCTKSLLDTLGNSNEVKKLKGTLVNAQEKNPVQEEKQKYGYIFKNPDPRPRNKKERGRQAELRRNNRGKKFSNNVFDHVQVEL